MHHPFGLKGLPGSLASIAFAGPGTLLRPTALVLHGQAGGPPAARDAIDIAQPLEENAGRIAEAIGKPVSRLRMVVLDKPAPYGVAPAPLVLR